MNTTLKPCNQLKLTILQLMCAHTISHSPSDLTREEKDLIFTAWYRSEPVNPTGTPAHYVAGCQDPRWDALLHTLLFIDCYDAARRIYNRHGDTVLKIAA